MNHNEELNHEDVFFMIVTNLLWREVCPTTDVTYVFPFNLTYKENSTCSILTTGTNKYFLDTDRRLALFTIARSFFVHLMVAGFAELERFQTANEVLLRYFQHSGHFLKDRFDLVRIYFINHFEHEWHKDIKYEDLRKSLIKTLVNLINHKPWVASEPLH